MAFVVAEPCLKCKYTHCVTVCPVDCFREANEYLVIDPDVCIDCGACVPECPSEAIYDANDLPRHWRHYIDLNARLSKELPEIIRATQPLPDAEDWKSPGKGRWRNIGDKEALVFEK